MTVNTFTFNTDCIYTLLHMIVTHYQNKTLYNRVCSCANFMVLLMFSGIYKNPIYNTELNEQVEQKYIMRTSGEHYIILFNEFNKFSNKPAQI